MCIINISNYRLSEIEGQQKQAAILPDFFQDNWDFPKNATIIQKETLNM